MKLTHYFYRSEVIDLLTTLPEDLSLPGLEYDLVFDGAQRWHFTFGPGRDPLKGLSNEHSALLSAGHLIAYQTWERILRSNCSPSIRLDKTSITIRVTKTPPNVEVPKNGRPHKDFCYLSVPLFDSHHPLPTPFYGELAELFGVFRSKGVVHRFKPSTDEQDRWFIIAFCQLPFEWEEDGRNYGATVEELAKEFLSPKKYSQQES